MKTLNSGNVVRLAFDQIKVGTRLRKVSEVQLANLLAMAEDTGITTPIHCRKVGASYELIDGAHRLQAARALGMPDIAALIVECRQDEARAMEASNNLGAARMTPLQTAVFVASWKRDYYARHPDRKPGVFKGNRHTGKLVGDTMALTRSVAAAFAISERSAFRILAAGENLSPEDAAMLDGAKQPISLKDLMLIGKVGDPDARSAMVRKLGLGTAKSAAQALASHRAEVGCAKPVVKDPVEAQVKALLTAWKRASKVARRRFLDAAGAEVRGILNPPVSAKALGRDEVEF